MKIAISKIVILFSLMLSGSVIAEEQWWSYLSGQEKGPSSTRVDLSFNKSAPLQDYPYVAVTGVTYENHNKDGLPSPNQIDDLNALQENLIKYLESKIPIKYAGTFTYQQEQLHYIYVQNNEATEGLLKQFYSTYCKGCNPYINVKNDPQWFGYKSFLFPSKQIIEYYGLNINE